MPPFSGLAVTVSEGISGRQLPTVLITCDVYETEERQAQPDNPKSSALAWIPVQ